MPKIFVKESYCFWESFWFRKVFTDEKRSIQFLRRKFLGLTVPKKFVGISSMFQFGVIENFYVWLGVTRFSDKSFLCNSDESFRGNPFKVSKISRYRKILCIIRVITFFSQKFSVSLCRKLPWAILQSFRKIRVSKKFMHNRGVTILRRKLSVSQCRKSSWASLHCVRKIVVSENFMHNRRYHVFPSKNFCLTVPKIFVDIPSKFQKKSGGENIYA